VRLRRIGVSAAETAKPALPAPLAAQHPPGFGATPQHTLSLLSARPATILTVMTPAPGVITGRAQRIGLMRNGKLDIKRDTRHGAS
jgi:hypothetical protein